MAKKTQTFSKTIDGTVVTQVAHTPADVVRFVYDGWRDITAEVEQAAELAKSAPAGKPEPKPKS